MIKWFYSDDDDDDYDEDMDMPLPGSPEAIDMGCACPVDKNHGGDGKHGDGDTFGWIIDNDCPVHGS